MDRFEHAPNWMRKWKWEHVVSLLLVLIFLLMAGQFYYNRHEDQQQAAETDRVNAQAVARANAVADCLRTSIVSLTDALNARLTPAEIERQATNKLIRGALSNPTPAEVEKLKADYEQALKTAEALRNDHPVPDYPSGLCTPG